MTKEITNTYWYPLEQKDAIETELGSKEAMDNWVNTMKRMTLVGLVAKGLNTDNIKRLSREELVGRIIGKSDDNYHFASDNFVFINTQGEYAIEPPYKYPVGLDFFVKPRGNSMYCKDQYEEIGCSFLTFDPKMVESYGQGLHSPERLELAKELYPKVVACVNNVATEIASTLGLEIGSLEDIRAERNAAYWEKDLQARREEFERNRPRSLYKREIERILTSPELENQTTTIEGLVGRILTQSWLGVTDMPNNKMWYGMGLIMSNYFRQFLKTDQGKSFATNPNTGDPLCKYQGIGKAFFEGFRNTWESDFVSWALQYEYMEKAYTWDEITGNLVTIIGQAADEKSISKDRIKGLEERLR